ncbi:MAG: UvrD-helicase domain-containing protein [Chloroherpetonaceae bacterium]|nr:UvrD-helicase domain-containing protein [Chloroherpetonaceae bacterium]
MSTTALNLDQLNAAQREAVATTEGPVMVIAGAGSGKTRVITHRIAYLIGTRRARASEILALTFTNKAAKEMKERVEKLLGADAAKDLWIGTFHSNFARLLRQHAELLGFSTNYSIYDQDDANRLIKEIMGELGINAQTLSPDTIQNVISNAKNKFVLASQFASQARDYVEDQAAKVYLRYAERLQKNNALDFDDLLIKPIELFLQRPDILEHYQHRFQYLMIDEYQDTNRAQYIVSKMLAAKHRNICVVGDDAQSIYSWRGADISNILNFQGDYPDAKIIRLEENYRSTQTILNLANKVIAQNKEQLKKRLFTRNEEGEPATLFICEDERREADKIAQTIRNLKLAKGYQNSDFAVFYRTNAQSRAIEEALRTHGIPYQVFGALSFYKLKEIKDVVAYLRFVLNPRDEESLLRVINFPARGIGEASVEKLRALANEEGLTLYELVCGAARYDLPPRLVSALNEFRMLIESLEQISRHASAYEVVAELYRQTRLLELLKEENSPEAKTRFDNLQEFLSFARRFSDENPDENSLNAFAQSVALMSETEDKNGDSNKVSLMTIHAAKGLEFPVVFVTGLEEKLFPLHLDDRKQLEEERRLFYVALTRAEKKLYLSYAKNRYRFGNLQPSLKSRFIDELDGELVVTEGGKSLCDLRAEEKERKRIIRDDDHAPDDFGDLSERWREPKSKKSFVPKPAAPSVPSETTYRAGMRVSHKMFGRGKIISVQGAGDDAKAKIYFERAGEKTLVLKFANLTVIE